MGQDDCDGVYKRFQSHPGYQPSAETSATCGESSVTVHVKVTGEGDIIIASADIEGSVAVTVKTPGSCPSQKLWIDEDLHDCGTPLSGWNCNPEARKIPIKLYGNEDPCPAIPTGDALEAFITGSWIPTTIPNIPLVVPCMGLTDITNTLPKGARYRWTAKATRCRKGGHAYETPTSTEYYATADGSTIVTGLYGETVYGDPAEYYFDSLVEEGSVLPGLTVIEGLEGLSAQLGEHLGGAENTRAQSLATTYPALDWLDNLHVNASISDLTSEGEWVGSEASFLCDLRQSGDFQVSKTFSLELEGGGEEFFTERFTMIQGNLYSMLEGGNASMAHLGINGASVLTMQGPLGALSYIQEWFNNPTRISNSGIMEHSERETTGGSVLTQAVGYRLDGDPDSTLAQALIGSQWNLGLDEEGVPFEAVRMDRFTNVMRERLTLNAHATIAPGVLRPMDVTIEEFSPQGEPTRIVQLKFSGVRRGDNEPSRIFVPTTLENSWYVRTK